MNSPGPTTPRSARRDHAAARAVVALAASLVVNAAAFGWALSSDMLRALQDRHRAREVAVASLTQEEWEANREVRPEPKRRSSQPKERPKPQPPPRPPDERPPAEPPLVMEGPKPPPPPPPHLPPSSPAPAPAPPPAAAAPAKPPSPPPRPPAAEERKPAAPPPARSPAARPEEKVARKPGLPAPPREEGKPVVELGPDAGPEVAPDESQPVVLADRDSRASRNTVATRKPKDAASAAAKPLGASQGKEGKPASGQAGSARRRIDGERDGVRGDDGEDGDAAGRGKELLAVVPGGELPRAGEEGGGGRLGEAEARARVLGTPEPNLKLSREAVARIARASAQSVAGAEEGEETALNARRAAVEALYMARVANLPDPIWEQEALANADAIRPFLDRPRVTEVTFQLDRNGHVSGLHVSKSSGIDAIDRIALTVVRKTAPYPPLPPELAARGLTIHTTFRWTPAGPAGLLGAAPSE